MNLRKLAAFIVAAATLHVPLGADAYFGLSIGQSTLKDWDSSVIDDGSFNSIDVEDSGVSIRVSGGFDLNPSFALEIGYSDFGEVTAEGTSDGTGFFWAAGPVSAEASADGFDLGFVGRIPTSDSFSFLGRAGVLIWDAEIDFADSSGSLKLSDDGNDVFFGIGGEFQTSEAMAMRLEFTRFSLDDSDIDTISFSLIFRQ